MEKENQKNRKLIYVVALILIIVVFLCWFFKGCRKTPAAAPSLQSTNPLETFYQTQKKHGRVEFSSKKGDKEYGGVSVFDYWFDGKRYRITWYHPDGSVRLHMISPDGKKLYHCDPEKETSVIAYTGPEFHHWIFRGPEDFRPDAGENEGDYIVYLYTAKELWDIKGSSQQFYCEDIKIYTKDDQVVKIVTRTSSEKVEESELVWSQYVLKEQKNDFVLDDTLFKLPYPVNE